MKQGSWTRHGSVFLSAALLALASSLPAFAGDGPPQRVIVKYKDGVTNRAATTQLLGDIGSRYGVQLKALRTIATGGQVIKLQQHLSASDLKHVIADFAADPSVEYAEEDRVLHKMMVPNDTRYNEQWDLFEAAGGLNVQPAWDNSTGSGVVVAVIDTGYRPHADLAANIVQGYDFISDTTVSNDGNGRDSDPSDPGDWVTAGQCGAGSPAENSSWHGTHVAGTIAAVTNNGNGIAGIAFNAKVEPARVLGKCGGYTSDIADAIIWASGGTVSGVPANANPAKVLSLSLGGSGACDSTSQAAINSARSRGSVFIVAAGNENANASNSSPANCTGAVVIAAVNRQGGRAYYSNYGAIVDVAAPGGAQSAANDPNGTLSTLNAGTTTPGADSYAFYQGTSMATPHVSGVAALMLSKNPALTPDQIEALLKSSARAFPASCAQCGAGIVDAAAAVTAAAGGGGGGGGAVALTNGVAKTGLSGATGAQLQFTLAVPAGATGLKFVMSGGTGDADMYVKFGSAPTLTSYDCRPYVSGNAETCNIATAQTGTYYVMLNGYAAFSGVSLTGSYSTGGGGACSAGFTQYSGTLSGTGANGYAPNTTGYTTAVTGTNSGRLTGPGGVDFDLYLEKKSGSTWSSVKSSTGSTATESIDYSGTAGNYRWRVYAYSGSGAYTLCTKNP
jgi:serine protease